MYTPLNETGFYLGIPTSLGTTTAHINAAPKLKNKGRIVMASIGASVQNQISERLVVRIPELTNPNFKFINLCQPSQDINDWLTSSEVWDEVNTRMTTQGIAYNEVQVIWLQDDILDETAATFPGTPEAVKVGFISFVDKLKSKFPKLKQIFITGRPYSGFSDDIKHDEPKGYYNGWACKWLVEAQIAGEIPALPWICDSIYMWTDGTTPRADGLTITEAHYNADGIHLSGSGKIKFGDYLFDQLKLHSVSLKYFY